MYKTTISFLVRWFPLFHTSLILRWNKFKLAIKNLHKILIILISLTWLLNGLFCKVLNFVPRHQRIVARILVDDYSTTLTILIGLLEVVMAIWVVFKFKSRLNSIIQIFLVMTMNILEFIFAPDLLLWGRLNLVFALLFAGIIYYNAFVLYDKLIK